MTSIAGSRRAATEVAGRLPSSTQFGAPGSRDSEGTRATSSRIVERKLRDRTQTTPRASDDFERGNQSANSLSSTCNSCTARM